jgi:hypothetical protein
MIRGVGEKYEQIFAIAKRFFAAFVFACVLVATGYVGFSQVSAAASPPRILMYQGRLLNSNNVPVSDATALMSFALYTAASGGTCLWSNNDTACGSVTTRTVTLSAGLFSEALGDTTASTPYAPIAATVFSNNASVFLEVTVNGETLAPRKQMLASPYAVNSDTVDGYDTTTAGATSSMVVVTDFVGNLQVTGSPQGSGVTQGSMSINPSAGVVAGNEILLGVSVGGVSRFTVDAEGDSALAGDLNLNGGDLATNAAAATIFNAGATTITAFGAATILDLNNGAVTSTINIGGTSNNGANTINIATNSSSSDTINIGNNNAGTLIAVTGGTAWSIATNGNFTTGGDVAVNGNDVTSTGILRLTSGGAAGLQLDAASGIVYVVSGDSFAVGGSSLAAPFSVDASTQTVRVGTGASNDATMNLYASNGSTGQLVYDTSDSFSFTGGNVSHTGLGLIPGFSNGTSANFSTSSTVSSTSGNNLNALKINQILGSLNYSGIEGSGTTSHEVMATQSTVSISGASTTLTQSAGLKGSIFQTSSNNNLLEPGGYLAGVIGLSTMSAGGTTTNDIRGVYGEVLVQNGTITNGYAVRGEFVSGAGSMTTGYGVYGKLTTVGTNRYGVYGEASGGTANFAGYFAGSRVQIDADSTPDAPGTATGAGDLYIADDLESLGKGRFGNTTGVDDFIFTSQVTNTIGVQVITGALTSGAGMEVRRADDGTGTAVSGDLLRLDQADVTSGTANALHVIQKAAGNSIGVIIQQDNVADQTNGAGGTTIGGQALVLETVEAASNDDIMIIRSNGQDVLAIETDGSVLSDNAYSAGGADYAEYFPSTDSSLGYYEVVCADGSQPFSVKRCEAGNPSPFGVMSSDPGFIGNMPDNGSTGNVLVGMVGQIETHVTANEGAIMIGDPITTSTTLAGYGARAQGPARVIGFALEALSSGTGTIRILVQPQWYAGDVLSRSGNATQVAGSFAIAALTSATSATTAVNSANLQFRGSVWSGGAAATRAMSLQTTVTAANEYRLSVSNNDGLEVASVNQSGDLALAGRFYPSDRGALQGSAYIYFDGSAGIGGSFMRTNASGWATGSYDFAEMFPSSDVLRPGEVVVFGDASQHVKRSTGETYSRTIAGIVSTRPGFLAGENRSGNYPIALAGRVPTFVTTENGEIHIGDPLTTSSMPGYAMRATEPGPIVGYASEAFSGTTGTIVVVVNASYYAGTPVNEGPATANTISHLAQDIENFDTVGVLNLNGGQLLAIGSMASASGAWHLDSSGDIVTSGRLVQLVESSTGAKIETYAAASREMTVQLSGTIALNHGRATVRFDEIDPEFTNIIDENPSYRALVTPYGATGSLYVTNRTTDGFDIVESGAATSGVDVDWIVIAYRRDYAPITQADGVPAASVSSSSGAQASVMTDGGEVVDDQDEGSAGEDESAVASEGTEVGGEAGVPDAEFGGAESVEPPADGIADPGVSEGVVESAPVPVDGGDGGTGASDVVTP